MPPNSGRCEKRACFLGSNNWNRRRAKKLNERAAKHPSRAGLKYDAMKAQSGHE